MKRVFNLLLNLKQLIYIQLNSCSVYNEEIFQILAKIIKLKQSVKNQMKSRLIKNPLCLKLYASIQQRVFFNYKLAKKLTNDYSILHEKKINHIKRNNLFFDPELLYDKKAILINIGAMKQQNFIRLYNQILNNRELGNILYFNSGAEEIFHYKSSEMVGQNIRTLMPEPFSSNHDAFLKNFMKIGKENMLFQEKIVVGQKQNNEFFLSSILIKPNLKVKNKTIEFMGYLKPVQTKNDFFLTSSGGTITAISKNLSQLLNVEYLKDLIAHQINILMIIPDLLYIYQAENKNTKKKINSEENTLNTEDSNQKEFNMYCLQSIEEYIALANASAHDKKMVDSSYKDKIKLKKCRVYKIICVIQKMHFNNRTEMVFIINVINASFCHNKEIVKNKMVRYKSVRFQYHQFPQPSLQSFDLNVSFNNASESSFINEHSRQDNSFLADESILHNHLKSDLSFEDNLLTGNFNENAKDLHKNNAAPSELHSVSSQSLRSSRGSNIYKLYLSKKTQSKNYSFVKISLILLILTMFSFLLAINLKYIYDNKNISDHIVSNLLPNQFFTSLTDMYSINLYYELFEKQIMDGEWNNDVLYYLFSKYLEMYNTVSEQFFDEMNEYNLNLKDQLVSNIFSIEEIPEYDGGNKSLQYMISLIQITTTSIVNTNLTANVSDHFIYCHLAMNYYDDKFHSFESDFDNYIINLPSINPALIYILLGVTINLLGFFLFYVFCLFKNAQSNLNNLVEILFSLDLDECKNLYQTCENLSNSKLGKIRRAESTFHNLKSYAKEAKVGPSKKHTKRLYHKYEGRNTKGIFISVIIFALIVLVFVPFIVLAEQKKKERKRDNDIEREMIETQIIFTGVVYDQVRVAHKIDVNEFTIDDINLTLDNYDEAEQQIEDLRQVIIENMLKNSSSSVPLFLEEMDFCSAYSSELEIECIETGILPYLERIENKIKDYALLMESGYAEDVLSLDFLLEELKLIFILQEGFQNMYFQISSEVHTSTSLFLKLMITSFVCSSFIILIVIMTLGWIYFLDNISKKEYLIKKSLKVYPPNSLAKHKGLKVFVERTLKQLLNAG